MRINSNDLSTASNNLNGLAKLMSAARSRAGHTSVDGSYSPASGFDQMGVIHGNALRTASGSAERIATDLWVEIESMAKNLNLTAQGFDTQDELSARGFEVVDAGGGAGTASSTGVESGSVVGGQGLVQAPVVVMPAISLDALLAALASSKQVDMWSAQAAWRDVVSQTREVASGVMDTAGMLASGNEGEAIDAIVSRLQRFANQVELVTGNGRVFHQKTGDLYAFTTSNVEAVAQANAQIKALNGFGPQGQAAALTAERALLGYFAAAHQAGLNALLPGVVALTSPETPRSGGSLDAAFDDVGTGARYAAAGISAPATMVEALSDMRRAFPQQFGALNEATSAIAEQVGTPLNNGLFDPRSIATTAASQVSAPTTPNMLAGSLASPGGVGQAAAGVAATPINGFVPTTIHSPMTSRTGVGADSGRNPSTLGGSMSPLGTPIAGAPMTGSASGAGRATPFSVGGVASSGGVQPGFRAVSGSGASFSSPSLGSLGGGNEPHAGTRALSSSGSTLAGTGGGTTSHAGVMPAGAGAANRGGASAKAGKVQAVTTAVERDKNLRDLLGEAPPVVPGVIGDWVRETPQG